MAECKEPLPMRLLRWKARAEAAEAELAEMTAAKDIHARKRHEHFERAEAAEAEVKRLKKALQLYAGGDWTGQGIAWEPIDDNGAAARAALNPDATE